MRAVGHLLDSSLCYIARLFRVSRSSQVDRATGIFTVASGVGYIRATCRHYAVVVALSNRVL